MLATLNTLFCADAPEALENRVLWHDDRKGSTVTLAQLKRELSCMRAKIQNSNAQRWLLYSDDAHHFLVGFLALLGLKKKVVMCASRKPEWLQSLSKEFDAILSDEEIGIYDDPQQQKNLKSCFDFNFTGTPAEHWQPQFDGSEEIVFFTSGSTGDSKAIAKTLLALTNEVTTIATTFAEQVQGTAFISSVSHLHIYGLLFKLLLPLQVGGSSFTRQIEYPEQLPGLVRKFALENTRLVFISSPAFLSRLDLHLTPVTTAAVFSSGGPLTHAAALDTRQYFAQLPIEVYGSTETGGIGYRQQLKTTTPWTIFPGVELIPCSEGVQIISPNMPGQPAYVLDDQLDILRDGQFLLKGRKDRIIKIGEKRISLAEIEKFLETQPAIAQCVALLISGKRDVIGCAIVLTEAGKNFAARDGRRALVEALKASMRTRFEAISIPRQWRILSEIPINSQSKIDTASLLAEFTDKQDSY